MKYVMKFLIVFVFLLLSMFSAEATTYTLRTLSSGSAVGATDLFESRQGSDTVDKSVTAAQLKTFMSSSPTLVTPVLGVATITSLNKVTITQPASSAVLTIANGKTLAASNTITLTAGADGQSFAFPAASDTVAGLGTIQTFSAAQTFGTVTATSLTMASSGTIVAKASGDTTDINPAFGTAILGNPVVKYTYGTCTVAAVNGGTCVPLVGATSRTISVTNFDIVMTGTPITCTGILLEDTNGTPVVIATLGVATLTSGAHNVPLTATLGVGFGAGSGLTAAKGVQIIVNGSSCATATAVTYAITYTVQ